MRRRLASHDAVDGGKGLAHVDVLLALELVDLQNRGGTTRRSCLSSGRRIRAVSPPTSRSWSRSASELTCSRSARRAYKRPVARARNLVRVQVVEAAGAVLRRDRPTPEGCRARCALGEPVEKEARFSSGRASQSRAARDLRMGTAMVGARWVQAGTSRRGLAQAGKAWAGTLRTGRARSGRS